MSRMVLIAATFIGLTSAALAQEKRDASYIQQKFRNLDFQTCTEVSNNFAVNERRFAVENNVPLWMSEGIIRGIALHCEVKRYDYEIKRLKTLIVNHQSEISRIDTTLARDLAANPLIQLGENHRKSVLSLENDIQIHRATIASHEFQQNRLTDLFIEDITIIATVDPDAADDIIKRLMGELPQSAIS